MKKQMRCYIAIAVMLGCAYAASGCGSNISKDDGSEIISEDPSQETEVKAGQTDEQSSVGGETGEISYTAEYQELDLGDMAILQISMENNHFLCFAEEYNKETDEVRLKIFREDMKDHTTSEIILPCFEAVKKLEDLIDMPIVYAIREKPDGSIVVLCSVYRAKTSEVDTFMKEHLVDLESLSEEEKQSRMDEFIEMTQDDYFLYEIAPDGRIIREQNITQTINCAGWEKIQLVDAYFTKQGELYIVSSADYTAPFGVVLLNSSGELIHSMVFEADVTDIFCDQEDNPYIIARNGYGMDLRSVDIASGKLGYSISLNIKSSYSSVFRGVSQQVILLDDGSSRLVECDIKTGTILSSIEWGNDTEEGAIISDWEGDTENVLGLNKYYICNYGLAEDGKLWIIYQNPENDFKNQFIIYTRDY